MYIAVGAGHNPVAHGVSLDGMVEHDLASRVVDNVQMLCAPSGLPIIRIPSFPGDASTSLNKKIRFCNHFGTLLSCIMEIHYNSYQGQGRAHGTEVLVADHAFHLEGKTKSYATIMQKELIISLHTRDRGVKSDTESAHGKLGFLRYTQAPAMIIEVSFLTDPMDAQLTKHEGRAKTAEGITRAILEIQRSAG